MVSDVYKRQPENRSFVKPVLKEIYKFFADRLHTLIHSHFGAAAQHTLSLIHICRRVVISSRSSKISSGNLRWMYPHYRHDEFVFIGLPPENRRGGQLVRCPPLAEIRDVYKRQFLAFLMIYGHH